jgi:DNA-binding transcriptional MerR regulator
MLEDCTMVGASTMQQERPRRVVGALQVADLAKRAHVTPATVRYYARIGLLHPYRDDHNGYRRFDLEDLRRVVFIRKAQALGLTISDIGAILDTAEQHEPVCERVIELVRERLLEIERQCEELQAMRTRIIRVLDQGVDELCTDAAYCPLIEQVDLDEDPAFDSDASRFRRDVHAAGSGTNGTRN